MNELESLTLGDSELANLKENLILTLYTLGLDTNDLNVKLLIRTLENLFSVVQDRLDELNGYKLEVSSLHNAYNSTQDKFNSSRQDYLLSEGLLSDENKSLQAEVSRYRRRVRDLESRVISQAATIADFPISTAVQSGSCSPPKNANDVVALVTSPTSEPVVPSSPSPSQPSGLNDVSLPLSRPEDDEIVNELKREIITLRINYERVLSEYEEASESWNLNRDAFINKEHDFMLKFSEAENQLFGLSTRNHQLQSELSSARLELDELRALTPPSGSANVDALSEELLAGANNALLDKLADHANVVEALNLKCHEMGSVISTINYNLAGITGTLSSFNSPTSKPLPAPPINPASSSSSGLSSFNSPAQKPPPAPPMKASSSRATHVKTEPNVVFLGDSFLFGLREELTSALPSKYTSTTFKMTDVLLPTVIKSWRSFNMNPDFLVLSAGFTDVAYNELKSFKHQLLGFCQSLTGTQLIILAAPFNYLLSPLSCVNFEIHRLNKFLSLLPSKFKNVHLISRDNIHQTMIASKGEDPYYTVRARQILCNRIRQCITALAVSAPLLSPIRPLASVPS